MSHHEIVCILKLFLTSINHSKFYTQSPSPPVQLYFSSSQGWVSKCRCWVFFVCWRVRLLLNSCLTFGVTGHILFGGVLAPWLAIPLRTRAPSSTHFIVKLFSNWWQKYRQATTNKQITKQTNTQTNNKETNQVAIYYLEQVGRLIAWSFHHLWLAFHTY